jgi:hypothetical protein
MEEKTQARWDLLLLLSLLLIILSYPLLDRGNVQRMILGLLVFLPVILATVKLSQVKVWVWPSALLMSCAFLFSLTSIILQSQVLAGIKWGILAAFFAVTVVGLFDYLRKARSVTNAHLFTAASIYLLLGMQWFAIYSSFEIFSPSSFLRSSSVATDRQAELLYFSLVTLSTVGYGDIVPVNGEVRMLAALEGITGVLYIAITVALLVSAYKQQRLELSMRKLTWLIVFYSGPFGWAQSSSNQIWPEIEGFYSFNPALRLGMDASRSTDGVSYDSVSIGPTLNFFSKRFVKPVLATPNEAKNNMLVFGVGYRYIAGINQAPENQVQIDAAPQFPLWIGIQASDRNRVDLRFIEGKDFSWRYRNRLNLQRTFKIHRFVFSPYAQVEVYYNIIPGSWNKQAYQFGSDFPFGKRFDFELYYEHDHNVGSNPERVNALGVTAYIYF